MIERSEQTWTTRDGRTMAVVDMSDTHLANAIAYLLRNPVITYVGFPCDGVDYYLDVDIDEERTSELLTMLREEQAERRARRVNPAPWRKLRKERIDAQNPNTVPWR